MKKSTVGIGAMLVSLFLATNSSALSLVTSRGALGANDFIDWSQVSGFNSSASVTSDLGAAATASCQTETTGVQRILEHRIQGSDWSGDFAPGDNLLWAYGGILGPVYSIFIDFLNPVAGAGAQIQADTGGIFIATLLAYGTDDTTVLASYSLDGISGYRGDNSAIFIGVMDTLADIGAIRFSVLSTNDVNEPAINRLSLNHTGIPAPVPEPSTMFLLSAGLAGLYLIRRQAKS